MQSQELWNEWLAPYQPQLPLDALVVEVNKLFHEFEAETYDRRHPQVFQQGARLWQEMIPAALAGLPTKRWRILDFGCGTGFATSQLLDALPGEQIEQVSCFDLSPEMLARCREKIAPRFGHARFCQSFDELIALGPFNLLATNSLLHHLPDPLAILSQLAECLTADAIWLAGQEPSSRFYRNPACRQHYSAYQRQHTRRQAMRWQRLVSPSAWSAKLRKLAGQSDSPKARTARAAHERGLFQLRPSARLIDRLVDFHVAHSTEEAHAGRGFDYQSLARELAPHWRLTWYKSFSFMGPVYEGALPETWRAACRRIEAEHPHDGANFCAAWRRAA